MANDTGRVILVTINKCAHVTTRAVEYSESFIFTVHYGSHEVQNGNLSRPRLAELWIGFCSALGVTSNAL